MAVPTIVEMISVRNPNAVGSAIRAIDAVSVFDWARKATRMRAAANIEFFNPEDFSWLKKEIASFAPSDEKRDLLTKVRAYELGRRELARKAEEQARQFAAWKKEVQRDR